MLGATKEASKLLGFKFTVAYRTTGLDESNALADIFVWKLDDFLIQDFFKKKQQITFIVIICKFHIRGTGKAHNLNRFLNRMFF